MGREKIEKDSPEDHNRKAKIAHGVQKLITGAGGLVFGGALFLDGAALAISGDTLGATEATIGFIGHHPIESAGVAAAGALGYIKAGLKRKQALFDRNQAAYVSKWGDYRAEKTAWQKAPYENRGEEPLPPPLPHQS